VVANMVARSLIAQQAIRQSDSQIITKYVLIVVFTRFLTGVDSFLSVTDQENKIFVYRAL
jgi:hypothetical protein